IGEANFGDAKLEVRWNDNPVGVFDPHTGAMQLESIFVTATGPSGVLTFREIGTSGDNTGTFLTNVKVHNVIIIDETAGVDADSNDTLASTVAGYFTSVSNKGSDSHFGNAQFAAGKGAIVSVTPDFGTDGPAKSSEHPIQYKLVISSEGTDSGLTTTDGK